MNQRQAKALALLAEIGCDVCEQEAKYHLGEATVYELYELAEQGLVEAKTTFTLTDKGAEEVAR